MVSYFFYVYNNNIKYKNLIILTKKWTNVPNVLTTNRKIELGLCVE